MGVQAALRAGCRDICASRDSYLGRLVCVPKGHMEMELGNALAERAATLQQLVLRVNVLWVENPASSFAGGSGTAVVYLCADASQR